jgi:hypothetical protein
MGFEGLIRRFEALALSRVALSARSDTVRAPTRPEQSHVDEVTLRKDPRPARARERQHDRHLPAGPGRIELRGASEDAHITFTPIIRQELLGRS